MKKIFSFILIACLAITANAQLLWKVTGNGIEEPSYIFGTHHLAPISIIDSISGFQQAFNESTQVIGEVIMADMTSPETIGIMQKYMIIASDTTLKTLLTPEEFEMVNKFTQENLMIDIEMASKLKPAFITNNIAIVLAMKSMPNFNPQQQLDTYLQQIGAEQNKNIDGFETMEFQFGMLFDGQSLQRQTELLVCALNNVDKLIEETNILTNAYLTQDIDALYNIMQKKEGNNCDPLPGEIELLLDNRNIHWAEVFPEKIKAGSAFVVVGAGHLPGEKGFINLLRKQGYSVEPVK
ncbi:TraB/GumN family protein [Bacteroides sp. 519]|uniref:TraB/GumN family protein n=1 Tax=Bacteroides sp. 519 TaxID=2302937 RepID=UPI0013D1317C|nr:TraB/GumN family protein [Bacteroides sp. 519]NDV59180.1 TraB/GumN family protein [Bacteroides sp. 519]